MTLTEQGQRWTIKADGPDGRVDHFYADTDLMELEVVPAEELEMCQRYFPFMRRSRDEAVRKLSACQEELARVREAADTTWLERAEAAEAARDEAVKDRDKWQRVADGNERGWTAAETARDEAVKREKGLVIALENALAADTESETCHIIYAALDQSGKP